VIETSLEFYFFHLVSISNFPLPEILQAIQ
jgi:hypothetical protein